MKTEVKEMEAVFLSSCYSDFDGTLDEWMRRFYDLWRLKLTIDGIFRIALEVEESRGNDVFVAIYVSKGQEEYVRDVMIDWGYRNIFAEDCAVGEVEWPANDEFMDVYEVIPE